MFSSWSMSDSRETEICIAGGGPAGLLLGYLLGRCGIRTLVLESQKDFDRDFRGDTLHAGVMAIFASLGLAERIFELPHFKIRKLGAGGLDLIDFTWLKTKFPFVTMIAQSVFLDWLAKETQAFPSYEIEMGANTRELVRDDSDRIVGLRYRQKSEHTEVRAKLVVACDGRGSRMRQEAHLKPTPVTDLLEVLWFRLPRFETDSDQLRSDALTGGRLPFVLLERPTHYQIAAVINSVENGDRY
ncbi:MAG: 2-polyprenyl-6-methoxyphenol hydroxylase-like FAD-dependent oxidoreductase, partial [Verrucomicrobiales bacterium]|jgi:2-polyprenyl-6-methoxyphenol hydroxylase-like FAD-dependent oxidoreductase